MAATAKALGRGKPVHRGEVHRKPSPAGLNPSIGSVGDAYDNALLESINGLYKTECIGSRIFTPERLESIVDVELATMSWVQWYNTRRLHSTLGMVSPAEHEETYWAGHATIFESPERVAQPI